MRFVNKSKATYQATMILKMLLIGVDLALSILIHGCGAKDRILSTEIVQVGTVHVASSPSGEVYLDDRHIGSSPVNVPLDGMRHKVERTTYKPGPNIDDALIVGIPVTAVFPPAGLLVLLCYSQHEGFVREKRDIFLRDERVKHTIEVRHPEYKTARMKCVSDQLIERWSPQLHLTGVAKARRERDRKAADAARRKAAEEKRRHENILHITSIAEDTSGEIRRVTTFLNEIVNKSVETQKVLLQQKW